MSFEIVLQADNGGSLSERVYYSVRSAILSLALKPGARIDKNALAKKLGVSRFPLSEAVTRLSVEGIVRVYPQAGTYVAPFSNAEIREGLFLREALEVAAVERVACDATKQQIAQLRRNFLIQEMLSKEEDCEGFFKADDEMHVFLLEATGFPKLMGLAETLWLQAERARHLFSGTPGSTVMALEEHRAIVNAIVDGDPDGARVAMRMHIRRMMQELCHLDGQYPEFFQPVKLGGGKCLKTAAKI
ncbi:MAG: GntR family transcriptional regulator [Rhodobacteraceae bacterium]|nr:GntR family transcriptional regulator [Paracoccaceae bacterium]